MGTNEEKIEEWTTQYYHLIYQYANCICKDRSLTEQIAEETFLDAYENVKRIRRLRDPKEGLLHTARYFILKAIHNSWEQGENIAEKFRLSESVDINTIQSLLRQYEEKYGKNTK